MFSKTNQLVPQIVGPGLTVIVSAGTVFFSGYNQLVTVGPTTINLAANSTNYIYLNSATESIQVNQTGFPNPSYPIGIALTDASKVVVLVDKRADGIA